MLWNGYREYGGNWNEFLDIFLFFFCCWDRLGFFPDFVFLLFFLKSSRSPFFLTPSIISHSLVPPWLRDRISWPYLVCAGSPAKWHIPFFEHYSLFILIVGILPSFHVNPRSVSGTGFFHYGWHWIWNQKKIRESSRNFFTLILG